MSVSTVCGECWWQNHESCANRRLPAYGCTCTTCAAPPRLSVMRDSNPYCMRCGDDRGGPYGHETNECTWGRS